MDIDFHSAVSQLNGLYSEYLEAQLYQENAELSSLTGKISKLLETIEYLGKFEKDPIDKERLSTILSGILATQISSNVKSKVNRIVASILKLDASSQSSEPKKEHSLTSLMASLKRHDEIFRALAITKGQFLAKVENKPEKKSLPPLLALAESKIHSHLSKFKSKFSSNKSDEKEPPIKEPLINDFLLQEIPNLLDDLSQVSQFLTPPISIGSAALKELVTQLESLKKNLLNSISETSDFSLWIKSLPENESDLVSLKSIRESLISVIPYLDKVILENKIQVEYANLPQASSFIGTFHTLSSSSNFVPNLVDENAAEHIKIWMAQLPPDFEFLKVDYVSDSKIIIRDLVKGKKNDIRPVELRPGSSIFLPHQGALDFPRYAHFSVQGKLIVSTQKKLPGPVESQYKAYVEHCEKFLEKSKLGDPSRDGARLANRLLTIVTQSATADFTVLSALILSKGKGCAVTMFHSYWSDISFEGENCVISMKIPFTTPDELTPGAPPETVFAKRTITINVRELLQENLENLDLPLPSLKVEDFFSYPIPSQDPEVIKELFERF